MPVRLRNVLEKMWGFLHYYAGGIYRRLREEEVTLIASGIAFNWLFCLIPLLLLFTSILGIMLHNSEEALQQIDEIIDRVFRDQPYKEAIADAVKGVVGDIVRYRASLGMFGMAILVWTGTSLFSSIRNALHRVYRVYSKKNLFLSILEDILWVFIGGAIFVFLNFTTVLYSVVESLLDLLPGKELIDFHLLTETFPLLISFTLTLAMFFVVYRFIPDVRPPWRVAWVSAFTTAILWESANRLFGWYLSEFHSFARLYGTYAFVLVLFLWIYYSSLVFVLGGIIGQLYRERQPRQPA